jgi:hypothetical protein
MHGRHFTTRRAAMDEVIDWLGFYNARRLPSTLDYVSPMTFEQNWFAAQQEHAAKFPRLWDSRNRGKVTGPKTEINRSIFQTVGNTMSKILIKPMAQ